MKYFFILFISYFFLSCENMYDSIKKENQMVKPVKVVEAVPKKFLDSLDVNINQTSDSQGYGLYYIAIVDTGKNYDVLETKMRLLSKSMNIKIDMMDRFYNKKRNLIALPDNYPDDIYAGAYYPRRTASEELSLEYLDYYTNAKSFSFNEGNNRTIALVRGIYGEKVDADAAVAVLKQKEKNAFVMASNIYVGCIH